MHVRLQSPDRAAAGSIFGIAVLVLVCIVFAGRIGKEEAIMLRLFPAACPPSRARTKRLIPFVW